MGLIKGRRIGRDERWKGMKGRDDGREWKKEGKGIEERK